MITKPKIFMKCIWALPWLLLFSPYLLVGAIVIACDHYFAKKAYYNYHQHQ